MVMEERHLRRFVEEKFSILDAIRNIKLDEHRYATISIGVGRGGKSLAEDENWSRKALDMALGRGGDQVAIKTGTLSSFSAAFPRAWSVTTRCAPELSP